MSNYYFDATYTREDDCKLLRTKNESLIFSIYCAGVAVECMLRAYIKKNKIPTFDAGHDLRELTKQSEIFYSLTDKERMRFTVELSKMKIWNNNLRYYSNKKMESIMFERYGISGKGAFIKYMKKEAADFFDAANSIIKLGREKWT